jgi:hypothetical protein
LIPEADFVGSPSRTMIDAIFHEGTKQAVSIGDYPTVLGEGMRGNRDRSGKARCRPGACVRMEVLR